MNFANLLNHMMLAYNVHKRLLCFKTRIDKQTITRYLNGQNTPNSINLRLLAEAFWSYSNQPESPHQIRFLMYTMQKMIQLDELEAKNGR
jgi:hypothetical protein